MFGVLLESRGRRNRRAGGAAFSVAAHIGIIGAATVATVHGRPSPPERPEPVFTRFTVAPEPPAKPAAARAPASARRSQPVAPAPITISIPAPVVVPPTLPGIDLSRQVTPDAYAIGTDSGAPPGRTGGGACVPERLGVVEWRAACNSLRLTEPLSEGGEWRGRELLMRIVSSAKPRYPEMLRQAGIDGRVLVQFVVDTTGRIDMNRVKVLSSTHDQFTIAVRNALASFRFKPAEINGKRTAALAEMPFEFRVQP